MSGVIGSGGVKRCPQPLHAIGFDHHNVKAAGRLRAQAHQVMACGKDDAPLLAKTDAGRRPAMACAGTFSDLYKRHGAVGLTHDQVNLPATAPRRPIIALKQRQARPL